MKCIICDFDHEKNPDEAKDAHKTNRSFMAMIIKFKKSKKISKNKPRIKKVNIDEEC